MSSTKINWQKSISPQINALPDSGLGAFLDIIANNKNIISLSIGEPNFTSPLAVRKKAIQTIEKGFTSYTSSYGLLDLRKAIVNTFEKKYGVSYSPEKETLITVGVSEALDLAMRVLLAPGDEVLLPEPCYVANKACIVLAGGCPVPVPTKIEDGFAVQVEELEKHVTPKTKAIIIGYPTNPTGATLNHEQLLKIAQFAEKHNLIVLSDELYADLTFEGKHIAFSSLPGMKDRTILLSGFSKAYAMTGFRIGYVLAPTEVIEAMISIHQYTMLCAPTLAQYAALEALNSAEQDCLSMLEAYDRRRKTITSGLKKIGLPTFTPQGAFYIFPYIGETGLTSAKFSQQLLTKQEVAAIPGHAFGASGEGFIRCSYATSDENIIKALERIDIFVNKKLKTQVG